MKFYFNCNNIDQVDALSECGVRYALMTYRYVKNKIELCGYFDDVLLNHKYFLQGGNDESIPVINDIDNIKLFPDDSLIALGKLSSSRIEEDEMLKRLPSKYRYHGLGKGRWVNKPQIYSVDSSTWLSGVRGRKTDVFGEQSVYFGYKGRSNQGHIQKVCSKYKKYLDLCNVTTKQILQGEYKALMKAPIALYYMPLFKNLNIWDENIRE